MEYENQEKTATPTRRLRVVQNIKRGALIVLFSYIVLVLYRVHVMNVEADTAKKVAEIHSIRLTLADVDGSRLPPAPDQTLNDATVEGIDSNHNYVRDDVERWIFEQYPSEKERAVWMQWAKSEQLVMLRAINKDTLVAVMEEGSRANQCMAFLYRMSNFKMESSELNKLSDKLDNMTWNTKIRKAAMEKGYSFMTGSGPMGGQQCDVFPEIK